MNHKEGERKLAEEVTEFVFNELDRDCEWQTGKEHAIKGVQELIQKSRIPSVVTAEIIEFWKQWVESLPVCEITSTPRSPIPAGKCNCGTYPENLGPCLEYSSDGKDGRCPYCAHGHDCHHWAYIVFAQAWTNAQLSAETSAQGNYESV